MTDIADLAAQREEELRGDALAAQARRANLAGGSVEDSACCCHVCGEPISEGRRRAVPGVQTCIECQEDLEHELARSAR